MDDELDLDELEPTYIGPTWQVDDDGMWLLPERTLGWEIAGWTHEYLNGEDDLPWNFTDEQLRFILWWYAVDEHGRFVYRTGVLQRMKGWGKDPLLAVLCLVELCGPSRVKLDSFGLPVWNEAGHPVGEAHPRAWVQVTAVNQAQTTNTMALIPSLMSDHLIATYNIEPGAVLIRANGGKCRLEAVTSSYRAIEGKRTTFTLMNETHHWVSGNHGHKMAETIDGNATKQKSRYLAITNAYLPGEDSVAERMRESWEKIQEGRAVDVRFLYDSVEAHEKTPLTPEALRVVIPLIRGDAVWLDVEEIIASVQNTQIEPARSRRMWLNQVVADEDALYTSSNWKDIEDDELILLPDDEIVLGFDGGEADDDTGLVAIRTRDCAAFVLGHWRKPDDWPTGPDAPKWRVDKAVVSDFVQHSLATYKVVGFFADVALWESYIDTWAATPEARRFKVKAAQRHPIAWDMRGSLQRSTLANESLYSAITERKLRYDGDVRLRRHALNTRRRENAYGVSFGKESRESPRKVDLYAALMLAFAAYTDLTVKSKPERERTGRGFFT